jgi:hypothetical protein
MGPVGSGKSVACVAEVMKRALEIPPGTDNARRSRWLAVRNTYGELKTTTIKTWQEWFPQEVCPLVFDSPIRGTVSRLLPDGTRLEFEILFIALDRPDHAKKVLSLEITGAWINEARELPKKIVDAVFSRTGRYPAKKSFSAEYLAECETANKPPYWSGMIMDTNPPNTRHWWYRLAEEEKPAGWKFYRQPGALIKKAGWYSANPAAENVQNQPKGYQYWLDLLGGADEEWIKVMVQGDYGSVFDGKPVYHDLYADSVHHSDTALEIFRGLPLYLGWDFGLTPACIMGQIVPTGQFKQGQLRILREYCAEDMAIRHFACDIIRPVLQGEFAGMQIISECDPAGTQRAQTDGSTCIQELNAAGIPTNPARTNAFLTRRQAVAGFLQKRYGETPAFLLDPSCQILHEGFIGGYMFKRLAVTGTEKYKEEPEKNEFSHPHDALQYLALKVEGPLVQASDIGRVKIDFGHQAGWGGFV